MSRKRAAASHAQQQHEKPIDENDMTPATTSEFPETENVEDDGEPLGANFA